MKNKIHLSDIVSYVLLVISILSAIAVVMLYVQSLNVTGDAYLEISHIAQSIMFFGLAIFLLYILIRHMKN